jgi:hypothetical protein
MVAAITRGLYLAPHIPVDAAGVHVIFWSPSQIGMHYPPGFHQDSRWTPDEPHGVSGVHLPDSSVDSTWTQSMVNPPVVWEKSVYIYYFTFNSNKAKNKSDMIEN